jgi:hypothetical protein
MNIRVEEESGVLWWLAHRNGWMEQLVSLTKVRLERDVRKDLYGADGLAPEKGEALSSEV